MQTPEAENFLIGPPLAAEYRTDIFAFRNGRRRAAVVGYLGWVTITAVW